MLHLHRFGNIQDINSEYVYWYNIFRRANDPRSSHHFPNESTANESSIKLDGTKNVRISEIDNSVFHSNNWPVMHRNDLTSFFDSRIVSCSSQETPLLLITSMDAPESTPDYLSLRLIPVREVTPVSIFVSKNVTWFSWYFPRIFLTRLCSIHAANGDSCSQCWVQFWCISSQVGAFRLRSFLDLHWTTASEGPFLSLVRKCLFPPLDSIALWFVPLLVAIQFFIFEEMVPKT